MAGCQSNYTFENNSNKNIKIFWFDVMSKGGIWKNILTNWNMGVGTKHKDIYRAAFSCNANRRYRFQITDSRTVGSYGSCTSFYYPSATGWTKSTNIDFGDISRHCDLPQQTTNESPPGVQPDSQSSSGAVAATPAAGESPPGAQQENQAGSNVMSTTPGVGAIVLPGSSSTSTGQQATTAAITTPALPAIATATTGQCLVTSSKQYPKISLRCGVSIKDTVTHVDENILTDCPLVAGDMVDIQVVEGQREIQITGRASGGQWCGKVYRPGYYAGPCGAEKTGKQRTTVKTYFYQGRKMVESIAPNRCEPARLGPGVYRVVSERRVTGGGQPSRVTIQEAGLRLEGQSLIGDFSGLLSSPIEQK